MSAYLALPKHEIDWLDKHLLNYNGFLKVKPASFYAGIDQLMLTSWCLHNACYGLPTEELVTYLKTLIAGRDAIEIGAGNGTLGLALNIPITDSMQQTVPEIIRLYELMRQPVIKYHPLMTWLAANEAVAKLKPDVVIGQWVTQLWKGSSDVDGNVMGIDEEAILERVKLYVVIGHEKVHSGKRIMKLPHQTLSFDWLYSRSGDSSGNRIYIWEGRG